MRYIDYSAGRFFLMALIGGAVGALMLYVILPDKFNHMIDNSFKNKAIAAVALLFASTELIIVSRHNKR